jgi:hypothetical protein
VHARGEVLLLAGLLVGRRGNVRISRHG